MKRIILFFLMLALFTGLTASAAEKSLPKTRLMFLVGGGYHDFVNLPPIIKDLLEKTGDFEVMLTDDRSRLSAPILKDFDIVLFDIQGGELTAEQEKAVSEFVRGGKGIAGIHSASDSFKSSDTWWKLLGGRFRTHGGGRFQVKIEDEKHPICCWLNDFKIEDETYSHDFHPEAKLHVLARRPMDNEPSAWTQNYGKGRVFYTGLGHGEPAWKNPAFQELVVRGIYWAAGRNPKSPN